MHVHTTWVVTYNSQYNAQYLKTLSIVSIYFFTVRWQGKLSVLLHFPVQNILSSRISRLTVESSLLRFTASNFLNYGQRLSLTRHFQQPPRRLWSAPTWEYGVYQERELTAAKLTWAFGWLITGVPAWEPETEKNKLRLSSRRFLFSQSPKKNRHQVLQR